MNKEKNIVMLKRGMMFFNLIVGAIAFSCNQNVELDLMMPGYFALLMAGIWGLTAKFSFESPEPTKEEKEKLKEDYTKGLDEWGSNLVVTNNELKNSIRKVKMLNSVFILLAVCFMCSTIAILFFVLPVPSGLEIWLLRGVTGISLVGLIAQNILDGPFIRSFRIGRMTGKTLVLIKRADGKWGWVFDMVRGSSVTSDIYGEFAITKESMASLDGVACGMADDSEGLTLPLTLAKIAQELKVEGIVDLGTLDSLYGLEEKVKEYSEIKLKLVEDIKSLTEKLNGKEEEDAPITEVIEQHGVALEKVEHVLTYLNTIQTNYPSLVTLNKKTLVFKPILDFFETYANNPIFKRTSRERAIAMEKAKGNKGENMGQIAFYFCMAVLAVGLCVYLIKTGAGQSIVSAAKPMTAGMSGPQGIN